ncbi:dihydrodipicolinate synthase family protein [Microvirga pakistanensis]|uniref:dihydrodipicolinate synthase family protein n=1 Tax=Microvirga pakistanensis TaxID=1682650 RepID=UPI001069DF55|nr:dihydrodipicolinate synthase family protein [Microvirga pakistanensis]
MSASQLPRGVLAPVTTPFDAQGNINEGAYIAQLEWMEQQGVHGVVVGGSTGEGYTLTEDELARLIQLTTETLNGRLPVLASIIADSTRAAVERAGIVDRFPIAGIQVAPPHYIFRPSDDGIVAFYDAIAQATNLPLVIYNVIPWTNVTPALAARIMEAVPQVQAVKQSDKDFGTYVDLVRQVRAERVFAAIDGGLMSCYDVGAIGSIAAIASAAPRASVALWNAVRKGDREQALLLHRQLLDVWMAVSAPNLPAQVKTAQALQGVPVSLPRAPMTASSQTQQAAIARALSPFL